ncbi:MAG TPA: phosphatidylserine decarboxylase [Planctomycetes bacterium]|nr:phosphatidylserine decarboxylase [Planctomycetota bacterium]
MGGPFYGDRAPLSSPGRRAAPGERPRVPEKTRPGAAGPPLPCAPMGPFLRMRVSLLVGWLADRRVPTPLRGPVYRTFARFTGANIAEAQMGPRGYASLGAFFVRRLEVGARTIDPDPASVASPCDGRVQAIDRVSAGSILQAKGRPYRLAELLGSQPGKEALEGALAITIYLGPSDYHRVHSPVDADLDEVRWIPGDRRSVAAGVVDRIDRVFSTNERAVLRLSGPAGPFYLVMVGALNVGRIRVVGVEPGATPRKRRSFAKGEELARFEMGSTVVLVFPAGTVEPDPRLALGTRLRLGERIGTLAVGSPL